jgi:hypothetical protein
MSAPTTRKLSDTLHLSKYPDTSGYKGYWLYDCTRGQNLSMRVETVEQALIEALTYYQKRLTEVEKNYKEIKLKVDAFVDQFIDKEEDL